jgi:beta-N-acetylhexosaminidase
VRVLVSLAATICALALVSCTGPASTVLQARDSASPDASHAAARPTPASSPAVPDLTPAQLAGQRVIFSYHGLQPPARLLSWIRQGEVGGVIFFGSNIASPAQLAGVIAELDKANASPGNPLRAHPLLLMTDQEGGVVRRLPGPPTASEKQIGQSAHPAEAATAAGTGAGRNLAGAGLNVNLAPVLDVYQVAGGFDDQYGRSYSSDPRVVAALGADFIRAQQATGVAAAAKHFPGLGTATSSQNTDTGPVTLTQPLNDLRSIGEYPYQAAIAAGVKLVMVSWAVYPALDASWPAGLSARIATGELRNRLGFTGVTITDALEAGALKPFGTIGHRAVLAAGAGMDLILCSGQDVSEGASARLALQRAYTSGTLDNAAFTAALDRVIALRSGLGG